MKNLTKKLSIVALAFAFALLCVPAANGKVYAASKSCNKTFTSGKLCYQVTGNNTCTVTGLKKSCNNATSCTIPSKVTCNGKTYKVTAIANKAFCNNDSLKTVKCANSVKTVGTKAFYGCDNLKNVSLGNCNTVKSNAFGSCTSLNKINCATKVSNLGSNCFGSAICKIVK